VPPLPQKIGKIFSGNFHVKFGHFRAKKHVKLGNFVNYSGKYHKEFGYFDNFSGKNHVKFGHFVNFHTYFSGKNVPPPKLTVSYAYAIAMFELGLPFDPIDDAVCDDICNGSRVIVLTNKQTHTLSETQTDTTENNTTLAARVVTRSSANAEKLRDAAYY